MEKKVKIGILVQIYGSLLTENQLSILSDYANCDLTLTEIAENNNVSRQAVSDIVKKAESKLLEFEEKLEILSRMLNQKQKIKEMIDKITSINNSIKDDKITESLNEIKIELQKLSEF